MLAERAHRSRHHIVPNRQDSQSASNDPTPVESHCIECSAVENLIRQLSEARSKVNQTHSPILRLLHPEILSYIFEFCMDDPQWDDFPFSKDTPPPFVQLNIGAVCRTWRQIAWSTPQLWTVIALSPWKFGLFHQIERARTWLSRSGDLPLSIKIGTNGGLQVQEAWKTALMLLNQYRARWKYVDVNLPAYLIQHLVFRGGNEALPMLERFKVKAEFTTVDFMRRSTSSFHLKDLSEFPWAHLTHAHVIKLAIDEALRLLVLAPNLVDYNIQDVLASKSHFPFPEQPIQHQLQHLRITEKTGDGGQIFGNLVLPNLLKLEWISFDQAPHPPLIRLFQRSCSPLHTLHLSFSDNEELADRATFAELFASIPTLRDLSLVEHGLGPVEALEALVYPFQNRSAIENEVEARQLLPLLTKFKFWPLVSFSWRAFLEIFGPLDESTDCRQRPLQDVHVVLWEGNTIDMDPDDLSDSLARIQAKTGLKSGLRSQPMNHRTGIKSNQVHCVIT
ncbi:hypothetical protein CVT26_015265 [Gymnopilus dilepis]|uniref:Uncharacterized protein n=1 Tax=Gymnopilus dilepis TaxID=231916 RepID=A0A409W9V8_9AGAR|nr:hypothetical protein CVT26_015265 [Gymnopilus dilepis]